MTEQLKKSWMLKCNDIIYTPIILIILNLQAWLLDMHRYFQNDFKLWLGSWSVWQCLPFHYHYYFPVVGSFLCIRQRLSAGFCGVKENQKMNISFFWSAAWLSLFTNFLSRQWSAELSRSVPAHSFWFWSGSSMAHVTALLQALSQSGQRFPCHPDKQTNKLHWKHDLGGGRSFVQHITMFGI